MLGGRVRDYPRTGGKRWGGNINVPLVAGSGEGGHQTLRTEDACVLTYEDTGEWIQLALGRVRTAFATRHAVHNTSCHPCKCSAASMRTSRSTVTAKDSETPDVSSRARTGLPVDDACFSCRCSNELMLH